MSRLYARAAAVAAAALAITALVSPAQAAPSSTSGLYGAADPTYDGVFRQSLALTGLAANGVRPAPDAIAWLLNQQCADGGYQAYRADLTQACTPSDPANYAGEDTNSTAAAIAALVQVRASNAAPKATLTKVSAAATRATRWLRGKQNADGGWAMYPGAASDANSTGLALAAIAAQIPAGGTQPAAVRATRYLGSVQVACGSASGGALRWQADGPANDSATAQGFTGLAAIVPVAGPRRLSGPPTCAGSVSKKTASYLASTLAAKGALPAAMGGGNDTTSTAFAVVGLNAMGVGKAAVARAKTGLADAAASQVANPGSLGLLLQVARSTGASPTSFGGVNLVAALQATKR